MSLYIWKVGEVALARITKKVYAKVRIAKNEDGLFHDEKVLAISAKDDGSLTLTEQLCYHVEITRTGKTLWLPYTSLHLAERSRPFYGSNRPALGEKVKTPVTTPKKRKLKEDHILPLDVSAKVKTCERDLNVTFDVRHTPLKQGKYENAFKEFIRRGKEMLFDHFYSLLEEDVEKNYSVLNYLRNVDASTEDKLEMVIQNVLTEKEMENYLHQCWRYNLVLKQTSQNDVKEGSDNSNPSSPPKLPITIHTPWCLVCGEDTSPKLLECATCPSAFHLACRREWLLTVTHRKNPPAKPTQPTSFVKKVLSSTRTLKLAKTDKENTELCPSCMWGPTVGYDDVVWHKLGTCAWWPARVLTPGSTPSCLLSRSHTPHQYPLKYYVTENYAWADVSRMALFLPSHASLLATRRDSNLHQAVLDACDEYIAVYLT